MNKVYIEIHETKEMLVWLNETKEMLAWLNETKEVLPMLKLNEGIKEYIKTRVENCINRLMEANLR